ncbi:hypothetical protein [Streptomyces sp. NPDC014685]|uniref:hypothetical protein n=1 Tax=Streptomyces sp. NPDC014685 TaxID=3364881 RepID=UPI0036FDCB8E
MCSPPIRAWAARGTLVELLECLHRAATAGARPADGQWAEAWRRQRDAARALRADPDPVVRRAALSLMDGVEPLLERWRTETDPAVRLPVLLELGAVAATEGAAAERAPDGASEHATVGSWAGPAGEVRAVVADVLRDGEPVMKVAALHAWARLDRDAPVRRPSAESALLPVAGGLSADPDDTVRLKAASLLAALGRRAAPYADRLRHIMENTDGWRRMQAARALWAATGEPESSVQVLEEFVLAVADGDDGYGTFDEALRALVRIGTVTPASRTALRTLRERDGRLSPYGDYRAFLQNEKLRGMIEEALALP